MSGLDPEMGFILEGANRGELAAYEWAVQSHCVATLAILDGKDNGGSCNEPWATVRERLLALVEYNDELHHLNGKLAGLLTGTVDVLRGSPPPLVRWSWHDIPELVQVLIAERDALRRRLDAFYEGALYGANALALLDPSADAEDGRLLERLALALEEYEKDKGWMQPIADEHLGAYPRDGVK